VEHAAECKAIVHVDPVDRAHPLYEKVEELLCALTGDEEEIDSFHDLRVAGEGSDLEIAVDVVVNVQMPEDRKSEIAEVLKARLRAEFQGVEMIQVSVERPYHGGRQGTA
jgi:divalent metal cation (Fe/Co/Zn/Cd) transporter